MNLIALTKGRFAKVDDDLYNQLNQYNWHFDGKYARRNIRVNGKLIHIYMHKVVAGIDGMVDHADLDTLNDQSYNLRPATKQLNAVNARKAKDKSSIYKGVSKHGKSWRIQIWYDNEKLYDACFPTELQAGLAYDLNASVLFGEYARLNFASETTRMTLHE
jgi:hypothetical protein